MTKYPSLQGVLTPCNYEDYKTRAAVITAFRDGETFNHHIMGRSIWVDINDYRIGDFVKFKFDCDRKACFYRIIESDLL